MNCTKTIFPAICAMESLKAGGPSEILASRMEDPGVVLRAGVVLSMGKNQARQPSQSGGPSSWKFSARNLSQSGRSEPLAELAQPALSSRRAYIPAALTPNRPGTQLVVTQYLFIHDNNFGMKSSVFGGWTVHDMRLKCYKMFICIVGLPAG